MKLMDFEHTVNVTLGLPIIRTSVDHGTAFDIAGKNEASEVNLLEAMNLATRMAREHSALTRFRVGKRRVANACPELHFPRNRHFDR